MTIKGGNRGEFKEGEIFYRYSGQTRNIIYTDLNQIIQNRIEDDRKSWHSLLNRIVQIKPDNALLFDLKSGIINGKNGTIVIDESIVDKIKYIKEGKFEEKNGAPTLKLIGEISPKTARIIQKTVPIPHAINVDTIHESFFDKKCAHSEQYIKQLCYEGTPYLPFWFFVHCNNKDIEYIRDLWNSLHDVRSQTRKILLKRLDEDDEKLYNIGNIVEMPCNLSKIDFHNFKNETESIQNQIGFPKTRKPSIERSMLYDLISNNTNLEKMTSEFIKENARPIFEAISHLTKNDIKNNEKWILKSLQTIHSTEIQQGMKSNYRKAICHVDANLYRDKVIENI